MVETFKPESQSIREEMNRLRETWDRSIRITWVLLIANFVSLAVLLAIGFSWL
jgi:hypothetical protein